ncbi:GSU2403 family nucleotidyltransferase fold protein [Rhodoferax sp.]|uniref:GSU2403 family nucleotidyltransferase fold protein n=1 Tax=Rhodoferax sp. TaxID=50421 RepID=UPI002724F19A|nr:GSU2403 family nucleotidyltransferase fold protein [Rhodoferax sp.]MDO9198399.1 GSU2403 family nucleotidyltransferase fold protein [Rhodoferax sp.]
MLETSAAISRQYIDAVSVFEALEEALEEAAHVRGGMYWHAGPPTSPELKYLVRTTPAGAETSLGPRTMELDAVYARFTQRKRESAERVSGLQVALVQQQRLNRALRVGRVDPLVVALLNRLASTKLSGHFRVVGTHALYAYEAAAGVRLDAEALATRDIDLLWDTRKRIIFSTQLARVDSSMLGVLKKVDATFRIRKSQKYTAVNKDGFEVDIIRREQTGDDPHPIKLSADDEDFWVVQARRANVLLDSPSFSAVIVASNGTMARMTTVHPATFVAFKRWLSTQTEREAMKRRRDVLQADAVQELLEKYLPHL